MKFAALLLVLALPAFALDYQVCNRTPENLDVAYAVTSMVTDDVFGTGHYNPIESQGWYSLSPGECQTFSFTYQQQSVYFFAKGDLNTHVGQGGSFCVRRGSRFHFRGQTIGDAGKCSNAGGNLLGFYRASPGTFNFNDNKSYVRYCNRTSGNVFYAKALYDDNTWKSNGWGKIPAGDCETKSFGHYRGDLYVGGFWVDNGTPRWWQGPAEFCVDSVNAFNYSFANSMSCSGQNQRRLGMFKLEVGEGIRTFTFQD
jgi:uncharacterized membrane protein